MDRVLKIIRLIPPGKVVSYGQVALMAGTPRGARFVGGVLCFRGEDTPWWRVINNAGRISTSCQEHTALMQKDKLMAEGVAVGKDLSVDIEVYRWRPGQNILKELELGDDVADDLIQKYF